MTEKIALTPKTHTTPPAKFSHGVKKGNILQVAGQVGFLPAEEGKPPTPAGPTLREQTLQTLANVRAILEEGGATWDDAMMIRVYLTDVAHFAEMNQIYNTYFEEQGLTGPPPPARRCTSVCRPASSSRSTRSPYSADPAVLD